MKLQIEHVLVALLAVIALSTSSLAYQYYNAADPHAQDWRDTRITELERDIENARICIVTNPDPKKCKALFE